MIWDLRMSNRPINELAHPKKAESAVNQIIHSTASFGTIISGYENGDIISYSSSDIGNESWVHFVLFDTFFTSLTRISF